MDRHIAVLQERLILRTGMLMYSDSHEGIRGKEGIAPGIFNFDITQKWSASRFRRITPRHPTNRKIFGNNHPIMLLYFFLHPIEHKNIFVVYYNSYMFRYFLQAIIRQIIIFRCTHFYAFRRFSQNCEKRLLVSSCLSVRPHGTTRLPLDGF